MTERRLCHRGQGMTEYIIIIALIAISAIGVITIFGNNIRDLFTGAPNASASETAVKIDSAKSLNSETTSQEND